MYHFLPTLRHAALGLVLFIAAPNLYAQDESPIKSRLPNTLSKAPATKQNNARGGQYSLKQSKVAPELWGLYQEYEEKANRKDWQAYTEQQQYSETLILWENKVVIEAVAQQGAESLKATLEKLGLERGSAFGRMVSGLLPITQIEKLEQIDNLLFVRPGYRPISKVGSVTSQGDAAQGTDIARNVCGVNGAGITVGILSDSYNALGGAEEGAESGDLPGPGNPSGNFNPTIVLEDIEFGIDEGRAMAEIVYDVAPEATLAFHTAVLGQANFANGILRLAEDAGAEVIVDDIGYLADPFFQDGIVAQAVDQVKASGATYFSAAGNSERASYESEFRPSSDTIKIADANGNPIGDYVLHDFDPGDGTDYFQRITTSSAFISFQWSQPYASICPTSPGAASDLDILVFTREGDFQSAIFGGFFANVGGDPFEILSFFTDFSVEAYIVIGKFVGIPEFGIEVPGDNPNPERIKYINFGSEIDEEYATNSGTIFGHPNAAGAIAVGAVPYFDTPAFGDEAPILEPFSSAGGVPILLTPCGEPIAPEVREKPEVSGPDGGNTTFFFADIAEDEDDFPNFFGTSASAPHVAGLAALMLQAADISPDSIESILQSTALDMDDPATPGPDPGFDFGTGYGFVQAPEALSQLTDCAGLARLELYDADTDSLLVVLNDGDTISSDVTGTDNLAIRAITFPEKVGSVEIRISGSLESQQIESFPPYASFGDDNPPAGTPVDYAGRTFEFGTFEAETYTVEATAYTLPKAQGDTISTLRLTFALKNELLTAFNLIDATTDEVLFPLTDFTIINLSLLGDSLNIRAVGNDDAIGSVEFVLEETDIFVDPIEVVVRRTENIPPFALFGDKGFDDYRSGTFAEAFYLLTATPYSEDRLQGMAGEPISVIFAVSDDGGLPDEDSSVVVSAPVVYPNPLGEQSNNLRVKWAEASSTSPVTLRLLNQQGEELMRQQANEPSVGNVYQMDVQRLNLAPGMYFLRIERADAAPKVVRVLKE